MSQEATVQGTMLWFNEAKDHGYIETEDGERLYVDGAAFAGSRPEAGRCKGTAVEFALAESESGRSATEVVILPFLAPRRARRRRGG